MTDDVISDMKKKTADALEEAARKLRESEEAMSGEEIWDIVHDAEGKLQEVVPKKIKAAEEVAEEAGEDIRKKLHDAEEKLRSYVEAEHGDIEKKVRSVESFVTENPIPAVAIAAGAGLLFGMIAARLRD
ncbi:ElaB/YqjD/DUF883 family membrane-anchored ribosome-binding protein [Methanocalculus alkaliphilus]|uniref:hypothetical protein n=1 Tax=Methanocalculus alkaliphilus TaxID=768730 RepID=UPI00209F4D02|nr:hypothetical protein [Methanocalculus alkaliphilus]MCP1715832.1 ElaB/YqjD/DUF883 family membrane-anchored ribosome-binding protein [Methanocalculus alkaliphilus]